MPRRGQRRGFYPDLASYFAETGDTQVRVAQAVGITQGYLSRVTAGVQVPRPALAARLAAECRISVESFTRVYLARQQSQRAAESRPRRVADHTQRA